jgi:hypothetical protein
LMGHLRTPIPTADMMPANTFIGPSRRRSYGLATVLPTIALALAPIAAPPAEAAFGFRKLLTIDNTRVSGTADHANFPVLVSLPNDPDLQAGVQSLNGWDIEFRANDGLTRLDHEIELYDTGTGTLVAWVRIPTLSYNSDTLFYIYYGDAGVQCSLENPAGVWDDDYVGVWHLDETGAGVAGEFADSTSNSNDGQGGGGVPARATAQIAGGQDFDGANDYITVPGSTSLQPTAALTLQAWVYVRRGGVRRRPLPAQRRNKSQQLPALCGAAGHHLRPRRGRRSAPARLVRLAPVAQHLVLRRRRLGRNDAEAVRGRRAGRERGQGRADRQRRPAAPPRGPPRSGRGHARRAHRRSPGVPDRTLAGLDPDRVPEPIRAQQG